MSTQPTLVPTHLDFVSVQVHDLNAARHFYQEVLGFALMPEQRPGALVFQTQGGAIFAVRLPLIDLDAVPQLGWGVGLWFACADSDALHARLATEQVHILNPLTDGPFGQMFTCTDPDGYALTFHQAP